SLTQGARAGRAAQPAKAATQPRLSKRARSSRAAAVLPQPCPQLPSLATDAAGRACLLQPRSLFQSAPQHLGRNEVGAPRPPGGARAPSEDPVARPPSACLPRRLKQG